MRLFRVIVPVGDIDAAAAFYARVLGTPGARVSGGRHYFDCEGVILACFDPLADGDDRRIGPNPDHIYLATDDLPGTRRLLVAELGERAVGPIQDQPWGERSVYTCDPWSNRLCFVDRATMFTGNTAPESDAGHSRSAPAPRIRV